MSDAERIYRSVCGDCHAAPDPHHYDVQGCTNAVRAGTPRSDATDCWPALLARMDEHRVTMARPPLTALQQVAVEEYTQRGAARPALAGPGHNGTPLSLPANAAVTENIPGRWLSLTAFFGLAALGLWRWSLRGILARTALVRPWTSEG